MNLPRNSGSLSYVLIAILGFIAVLPVWIPTFPAMADAPQHAAQVVIYSQLDHPGFAYSSLFIKHTLNPNLLGYSLLLALTPLVGVVAACKLAVSAALLALLFATSWLIAEFDGDPRLALLMIPGMYGFSFEWGFIGFLAAAPLGICFLILAKRYFQEISGTGGLILALFFLVVFCCHALVAAYSAGLAAVYAVANLASPRQLFVRCLPLLATVPAAGLWWLFSVSRNPLTHQPVDWDLGWDRLPKIFLHITGWPGALLAFLFVAALLAPVVILTGFRRQLSAYLLLAACLVISVFGPHAIFGVTAVYQRSALFILSFFPLALCPIDPAAPRRGNLAVAWIAIFVLAWTAGVAWRMSIFDREARGFSALLQQMAPGQRVLSINFERRSAAFEGSVLLHLPVWYSALKSGLVDPSFAGGNVDLVLFRPEAVPKVHFADFEFHPERFNWEEHEGWRYRYFVVHSAVATGPTLFPSRKNSVNLRAREGDWWLYENTEQP